MQSFVFDEAPHPCRETIVKLLTFEEQSELGNLKCRTVFRWLLIYSRARQLTTTNFGSFEFCQGFFSGPVIFLPVH